MMILTWYALVSRHRRYLARAVGEQYIILESAITVLASATFLRHCSPEIKDGDDTIRIYSVGCKSSGLGVERNIAEDNTKVQYCILKCSVRGMRHISRCHNQQELTCEPSLAGNSGKEKDIKLS